MMGAKKQSANHCRKSKRPQQLKRKTSGRSTCAVAERGHTCLRDEPAHSAHAEGSRWQSDARTHARDERTLRNEMSIMNCSSVSGQAMVMMSSKADAIW